MASTIKVDNVQNQPGTNTINKCGTTVTVGACGNTVNICGASVVATGNVVKSNALQASDGGNIVNQCGTTVTLGATGDTIALASGATQSGFGRTGTVDWITTPKVTGDSPITGVTGKGYFLNTTAGTITVNLPAGAAGSIVSMADYAATWQTNNVTVTPNGSEKIGGVDGSATLDTEGQSVTFVYIDGTQGWINTMDSTSNVRGTSFVTATVSGACNTLTTVCTNYKLAKFVGPGTFCVSALATNPANDAVGYMVVAGGGGAGADRGGGGGAGGFREGTTAPIVPYTASPLAAATGITVTASPYPIVVGAGGVGTIRSPRTQGTQGGVSTFSTICSAGGGNSGDAVGSGPKTGGSGGGGVAPGGAGGAGNTPPTSPAQGTSGGAGGPAPAGYNSGAGGGASVAGTGGGSGGAGGAGATTSISATPTAYAGGGGGGGNSSFGAGGSGGGGAGGTCGGSPGTINTGGGGGGPRLQNGGSGGSGIVMIRYKFQ